jgi:hypothetical protein
MGDTTMNTSTILTAGWLASLLASMGGSGDEVAGTLGAAGARGVPADPLHDPAAVYVAARLRELACTDDLVEAAVTTDEVVLSVTPADSADGGLEVTAATPGALEDFLPRLQPGQETHTEAGGLLAQAITAAAIQLARPVRASRLRARCRRAGRRRGLRVLRRAGKVDRVSLTTGPCRRWLRSCDVTALARQG